MQWATIEKSHRFNSIANQKNVLKEPRCKIVVNNEMFLGKIGQIPYENGDKTFFEFAFQFFIILSKSFV